MKPYYVILQYYEDLILYCNFNPTPHFLKITETYFGHLVRFYISKSKWEDQIQERKMLLLYKQTSNNFALCFF